MLTIEPTDSNTKINEACITVPSETSALDRARLAALSVVFYGHHVKKPHEAYVYTEARGRKCFLLWECGFSAVPTKTKNHRDCITHPKSHEVMTIYTAVNFANMMRPDDIEPTKPAEIVEEIA